MSSINNDTTTALSATAEHPEVPASCTQKTHSVHVRDVPESVWCKARQNALLSGLPFKEYVTRLLAESTPFLPITVPPSDNQGLTPQAE